MFEQRYRSMKAEAERQAGKELGDALNAFAEGLEQALSRIDPKLEQLLYTFDPSALDTIKAMTRLREAAGQGHEYLSLRRGQQKKRSLAPETLLFGILYWASAQFGLRSDWAHGHILSRPVFSFH